MNYLVFCGCNHSLDRHGDDGCGGDGTRPCACSKSPAEALESAIAYARAHPWDGWKPAEAGSGGGAS